MLSKKSMLGLAAFVLSANAAKAQFHETIVQNPSLGAGAQLGVDIAIDGELAAIGCRGVSNSQGAALLYAYQPGTGSWVFDRQLFYGGLVTGDSFGTAVGIHGDRVVVTAPGKHANGVGSAGLASVFEPWSSDPTIHLGHGPLYASDPQTNAGFGRAVAIRGDWVFVGAPDHGDGGSINTYGAVYVYQRNSPGSNPLWGNTEDFKIIPTSGVIGQRFGTSIDMSSNRAIVGAPLGGASASGTGAAYIFERSGSTWSQQAFITQASDAGGFGYSVALHGDYAAIGAPYDESDTASWTNTGSVFIYKWSGTNWQQMAKLTAPSEGNNLLFGVDVALDAGRLVVGTLQERAYVFSRRNLGSGDEWFVSGKLEPSDGVLDDDYGRRVAMTGEHFAVGAMLADPTPATPSGGKAYFYRYPTEFAAYCFAHEDDCPCNNDDPDAGCENSTGSGAYLSTIGSASLTAHDFRLVVTGLPANQSLMGFASQGAGRFPFRDGLRCATGSIQRMQVKNSGANGTALYLPNQTIDALGVGAGNVRYYQVWYRDNAGPCGHGSNTSNAVRVLFGA